MAARVSNTTQRAGMGFIFKDGQDTTLLANAICNRIIVDPCIAQLEVIRCALVEARRREIYSVEIRLDVKSMVAWLQRKTPPVAEAISILEDIFHVQSQFACVRFVYIHRQWNEASHLLINHALSSLASQTWVDQFPWWLEKAL